MRKITVDEIQVLSKYVFDATGILLGSEKGYLLESRLQPVLSAQGLTSYAELYRLAKADQSGHLEKEIIEAITTNETFFFRDQTPFDLLRHKIIPDLIDRRGKGGGGKIGLRIWSAACSTGQEIYSIAITLLEMLPDFSRYDIHILGTDISDKVIAQASYGKYNQFEVQRGLPAAYRQKYFRQIGTDWRVKDEIRALVQFRKLNLMRPFQELGSAFDVVFCRNVAIYFNHDDKVRLFQKIAGVLKPDGALIVGGSETLAAIAPDFQAHHYLQGVFYQLKGWTDQRQPAAVAPAPVAYAVQPLIARPLKQPVGAERPTAPPPRPVAAIPAVARPTPVATPPPPVGPTEPPKPPAAPGGVAIPTGPARMPPPAVAPPSPAAKAPVKSLLTSIREAQMTPAKAVPGAEAPPSSSPKRTLLATLRQKKTDQAPKGDG